MKILALFSITLILYSTSTSAGLYRWIDAKGNVHYSDRIPPKAVKYGHVKLSPTGLKKQIELSAKQKQEILDREIQKKKDEEERKKKALKAKLKKMEDDQLLAIYSNKKELINVYEGKIEMATMSIKLLKKRHKVLSSRLAKAEIKQEKMKNPKFKEILTKKIDDMLDGLKVYQQAITENMVEKNKLEKEYALNIKRFNRLTEQKNLIEKENLPKTSQTEKTNKVLESIVPSMLNSKKLANKKTVKSKEDTKREGLASRLE